MAAAACRAIQVRSPSWLRVGELGVLRLPDPLGERTLSQEPSSLGGPFVVLPRQDDRPARHAGHERNGRIVVPARLEKAGTDGLRGDLSKGSSLELRDELLVELPRDAPPFVAPADRVQLTLLDDEAQAEADQRGARQEDRRQEEQDLPPVQP